MTQRFLRFGLMIGLLVILIGSSNAGSSYTITTTIERESGTEVLKELVTTFGDDARIDFIDADRMKTGEFIMTSNRGRKFVVSTRGNTLCSDFEVEQFFIAAGRPSDKSQRFFNAVVQAPKVEKLLEKPGGYVDRFETTRIRMKTTISAQSRFLIFVQDYLLEETQDIWLTNELKLPFIERNWLNLMANTGFEYFQPVVKLRRKYETAVILRSESVHAVRESKQESSSVTKETVVVSQYREVGAGDLPPDHFDLPDCDMVPAELVTKEAIKMLKHHIR